MPTNHSISSAMLGLSLASLTSGPPQRASIPVLALEAQPPTGLPSRPTCRGAGPLQVLRTQDSRATPGRPARFGQSTMPTSQSVPRRAGIPIDQAACHPAVGSNERYAGDTAALGQQLLLSPEGVRYRVRRTRA